MWHTTAISILDQYVSTGNYTETEWKAKLNFAVWESINESYSFASAYTITATGNLSDWVTTPDPTTDIAFIKFTVLKTWCNLWNKDIKARAKGGIYTRNGDDVLDTRNVAKVADSMKTPCDIFAEEYEKTYSPIHSIYFNFAEETQDD